MMALNNWTILHMISGLFRYEGMPKRY